MNPQQIGWGTESKLLYYLQQQLTRLTTILSKKPNLSDTMHLAGNYDASTNLFPTTGGYLSGGGIMRGDVFDITVDGTLGGTFVGAGSTIRALVDNPGQTLANWKITF